FAAKTPGGKQILARPTWIEMAPDSLSSDYGPAQCKDNGVQRVWVAFPGCQLIAKMVYKSSEPEKIGTVEEALKVTAAGTSVITDLESISCPVECSNVLNGQMVATSDMGIAPATSSPTSFAIDVDTTGLGRMVIADQMGPRIDIIPVGGYPKGQT